MNTIFHYDLPNNTAAERLKDSDNLFIIYENATVSPPLTLNQFSTITFPEYYHAAEYQLDTTFPKILQRLNRSNRLRILHYFQYINQPPPELPMPIRIFYLKYFEHLKTFPSRYPGAVVDFRAAEFAVRLKDGLQEDNILRAIDLLVTYGFNYTNHQMTENAAQSSCYVTINTNEGGALHIDLGITPPLIDQFEASYANALQEINFNLNYIQRHALSPKEKSDLIKEMFGLAYYVDWKNFPNTFLSLCSADVGKLQQFLLNAEPRAPSMRFDASENETVDLKVTDFYAAHDMRYALLERLPPFNKDTIFTTKQLKEALRDKSGSEITKRVKQGFFIRISQGKYKIGPVLEPFSQTITPPPRTYKDCKAIKKNLIKGGLNGKKS